MPLEGKLPLQSDLARLARLACDTIRIGKPIMIRTLSALVFVAIFVQSDHACRAQTTYWKPPKSYARYELSNLRLERNIRAIRSVIAVDYRLVREGKGRPALRGRSKEGDFFVTGFGDSFEEKSGTIRVDRGIQGGAFGGVGDDFELFVVCRAEWSTRLSGDYLLISNVESRGDVGTPTVAASWSDRVRIAYEERDFPSPPRTLPSGMVYVDEETELAPGMKIKAGWLGNWEDAEVLGFSGKVSVYVRLINVSDKLLYRTRNKWLAVDPGLLERHKSGAEVFEPSIRLLHGSKLPLPDELLQIPADLDVPLGMPVVIDQQGEFVKAMIVNKHSGGTFQVRADSSLEKRGRTLGRNRLAVHQKVLASLDDPVVRDSYASKANKIMEAETSSRGSFIDEHRKLMAEHSRGFSERFDRINEEMDQRLKEHTPKNSVGATRKPEGEPKDPALVEKERKEIEERHRALAEEARRKHDELVAKARQRHDALRSKGLGAGRGTLDFGQPSTAKPSSPTPHVPAEIPGPSARRLKSYPIQIAVPPDSVVVSDDMPIKAGTPVSVCYARTWRPLTVLDVNDDSTLYIAWDGYNSGWNSNMARDQLIVKKTVLEKLKQEASSSGDIDQATSHQPRTWTDSTGKYQVNATLLEFDGTNVKLKRTGDGKAISLSLNRLSAPDREYLEKLPLDKSNPFD